MTDRNATEQLFDRLKEAAEPASPPLAITWCTTHGASWIEDIQSCGHDQEPDPCTPVPALLILK